MIQIKSFYQGVKGCYYITQEGKVINHHRNNYELSTRVFNGYLGVSLLKENGKVSTYPLHRLLMMAFRPVEGMDSLQINHIDGNKLNNEIGNLD